MSLTAAATPVSAQRRISFKPALVWLHRWAGLTLGLLFVLMGLSGALLVFEHDIDAALNPHLFHSASACAAPLGVDAAAQAVQAQWTKAKVGGVFLPRHEGGSLRVTFKAPGMETGEAMLDACTGALLGSRDRSAIGLGAQYWMPMVQTWHLNMFQGKSGRLAQGYIGAAIALLLAVGLYLAWPLKRQWRRALRIKLNQSAYRSHYDLHRSIGLLAALPLLLLALTGFYNGLPEVVGGMVARIADVGAERRSIARPALKKDESAISWGEAQAIAAPYLQGGATMAGISRQPDKGLYIARLVRADDWQRTGTLRIYIDMRSGKVLEAIDPLSGKAGDRFLAALFPLHSGQLGGTAVKWLLALAGLLPALFFITGITTWRLRRKK
ncbi:PepSY-associated TM helix domain-containing protein [Pseudoduganella aquatica]|uniref:PepSY-associated TM helix domain-containing protein n=1 Tax=Pseudoduganella aquatica TaxID=2660641 RepID=UPI001E344014|nr:PepSY-associated TM helix domain-containing protein [Pseudoduganella aquatica]